MLRTVAASRLVLRQAAKRAAAAPIAVRAFSTSGQRCASSAQQAFASKSRAPSTAFASLAAAGVAGVALGATVFASSPDYNKIRERIAALIEEDPTRGPLFVRLAWHAAGTYSKQDNTGGSDGATMRFKPECDHGANAGLNIGQYLLSYIKEDFPDITNADLWSLAGAVAIEEMGGPKIEWRAGRSDKPDGSHCTPDGRLPDAAQGADHLRAVFGRMGFTDQDIVVLSGAHTLGSCHPERSGFDGPWTRAPTSFSNLFFVELVNNTWTKRKWNGPPQFQDPTGELMMLPTDVALLTDAEFRKYVDLYAKDEQAFFRDFAVTFKKLQELGVKFDGKPGGGLFSKLFG